MWIGQTKNNIANLLQRYAFTKKEEEEEEEALQNSENWTSQNYYNETMIAFPVYSFCI